MTNRVISIELTGTNTKAVKAIEGVSSAASKAGASADKSLSGASSKIGAGFSKLDNQLGNFGLPFAGALGVIGGKLDETGKKAEGFGGSLAKVGQIAGVAGVAGLALVGAESLKAADSFDQAHARLDVATKNVGESLSQEGDKIKSADDKLTNLGFTSTDTESALAKLVPATHDVGIATGELGLAADIARAKNESLGTATQTLISIQAGNLRGLKQFGIATKDATGKTIDTATALKLLTAATHGQADAFTGTYAGSIDVVKAKGDELSVSLGELEKTAITHLSNATLDGVHAFQTFNSELGGVPGKLAAVGAGGLVAFGAIAKVVDITRKAADTFGLSGSAAEASAATTSAASAEEATATGLAANAAVAKGVALAAVGVAEDREAIAAAKSVAANNALAAALYDVGAADSEIVAASTAAATAQDRLTAASARTAAAQAAVPVEASAEPVAVGLGAVVGIATAGAAAVAGIGIAIHHLTSGTDLNHLVSEMKDAGKALASTGEIGGTALKTIETFGPGAAQALEQFTSAALAGKDGSIQFAQALANTHGFDAKLGLVAAAGAAQQTADAMGPAAKATALLGLAQSKLADDTTLASHGNHDAATRLTADSAAVSSASKDQATAQQAVNTATQTGVGLAETAATKLTAQGDASKAAAKQEAADAKATATALTNLGTVAGTSNEAMAKGFDFTAAEIKSLTAEVKTVDSAFSSSFDAATNDISKFKDQTHVSFQQFEQDELKSIQATSNWAGNLTLLAAQGLNIGFIGELAKAGVSSAGLVQSIEDNVKNGSIATTNSLTATASSAKASAETAFGAAAIAAQHYADGVNALNPTIHTTIDVPNVHIVTTAGGVQSSSFGGNKYRFQDGGYVPGPKGQAVPAIVHAGEFVVSNKMQDDAKASSRTLLGRNLTSTSPNAPSSAAISNADQIGVKFTPGTNKTSSTATTSPGLSAAAQASAQFVSTSLSALATVDTPIRDFNTNITSAIANIATKTKDAEKATADYTKAQDKLATATRNVNDALAKYKNDQSAASHVAGDQDLLIAATDKLNADRKAKRNTDADQQNVNAIRTQLGADSSASHRLAADLITLQKDYATQGAATSALQTAHLNRSNAGNAETLAKADLAAASDPSYFTKNVTGETSVLALFEKSLEVLVKEKDTKLAKAIAAVGPDQGLALAEGFAASSSKASAAEKALDAQDLQKADYTKFLGSFDKGGIVPGPIGKAGLAIVHGGEFIDNSALKGGAPLGRTIRPSLNHGSSSQPNVTHVHLEVYVDGVFQGAGEKILKSLQDHQQLNGPSKLLIAG